MKKLTTFSKTLFILSILKGIFVVSLILSLLLWSIPILSFNSGIWEFFQKRSGVIFGSNTTTYNDQITDFFKTGLKLNFLNENEFSHLQAVRTTITTVTIVLGFSFVFTIVNFIYFSKTEKKFLLEATRKISLIVFILMLFISIIILSNFDTTFLSFHKIFFVKNFAFPEDSLLKILYPDKFFYGITAFYLLSILIISLTVAIVSHRLKLK